MAKGMSEGFCALCSLSRPIIMLQHGNCKASNLISDICVIKIFSFSRSCGVCCCTSLSAFSTCRQPLDLEVNSRDYLRRLCGVSAFWGVQNIAGVWFNRDYNSRNGQENYSLLYFLGHSGNLNGNASRM